MEREGAEVASDATDYFTADDLLIETTVKYLKGHSQAEDKEDTDTVASIQGKYRQVNKVVVEAPF